MASLQPFKDFVPTDGVNPGLAGLVPAPPPEADDTWVLDPTTGQWEEGSGGGGFPGLSINGGAEDVTELIDSANVVWQDNGDGTASAFAISAPPLGTGATTLLFHTTLTSAQVRTLSSSPVTLKNPVDSTYYFPLHAVLRHNPGAYPFGPQLDPAASGGWWYAFGPGTPFSSGVSNPSFTGIAQRLQVGMDGGGSQIVAPANVFQLGQGGSSPSVLFGAETRSSDDLMTASLGLGSFVAGGYGLTLRAEHDLGGSGVTAASVTTQGSGFSVNDTAYLWGAGNGDCEIQVTAVNESGGITAFTITDPGSGYNTSDQAYVMPETGVGDANGRIIPTAVDSNFGNGTLDIWVIYVALVLS